VQNYSVKLKNIRFAVAVVRGFVFFNFELRF